MWAVAHIGRPAAVRIRVAAELASIVADGVRTPGELADKNLAAALIDAVLAATTDPSVVVQLEASGSGYQNATTKTGEQTIEVSIHTVYGFVE
jgi:hypothetical protein